MSPERRFQNARPGRQLHREKGGQIVYIGAGTLALILVVVLLIWLL
jgi:hypothetical protein